MKHPAVYIISNRYRGTLYIGVTSDLIQRVWQHKHDVIAGFSQRYRLHLLVYFELYDTMAFAISREKALKKWRRQWKLSLVEEANPTWSDLYNTIL